MSERIRTVWLMDKTCLECGMRLMTDGRREWCIGPPNPATLGVTEEQAIEAGDLDTDGNATPTEQETP